MDKVQKHNSFNTKTPSSESYRNYELQQAFPEFSLLLISSGRQFLFVIVVARQICELATFSKGLLVIIKLVLSCILVMRQTQT
jgi:hypothetical protein